MESSSDSILQKLGLKTGGAVRAGDILEFDLEPKTIEESKLDITELTPGQVSDLDYPSST